MQNIVVNKVNKKNRGVFATKNFKKGELILSIKGKIISKSKLFASSRYLNDHSGTIGKDKYLIFGYPEKYINHSCDPNVYEYKRKVIAMRDIKNGDEITFDYSICSIDEWRMNCHCNSKNCRRVIRGNFFKLPLKLQVKYFQYLDEWFKKEFKKELKDFKSNQAYYQISNKTS